MMMVVVVSGGGNSFLLLFSVASEVRRRDLLYCKHKQDGFVELVFCLLCRIGHPGGGSRETSTEMRLDLKIRSRLNSWT